MGHLYIKMHPEIIKEAKEKQSESNPVLIIEIFSEREKEEREEQPEKALSPMDVTLFGIIKVAKDEQL